jgi:hypothetical protein
MIAMNVTWLDDHFKQHQACIEFIEIDGSHLGENLASIVYSTLKKFNICQKLLTITANNAGKNSTLCHALYALLKRKFDDHLEEFPSCEGLMRFKGKNSQIQCLSHIINLIVLAILEALGSSTHKQATEYLDQAAI